MALRARVALLLGASWASGLASAGSTVQAVAADQQNPIGKVVTLLQEMKAQVEKEAQQDELAYDKYMCWCTTNRKEKTAAIENAEQQIADLTAFLAEAAGTEAALKSEIESLTAGIAEDQEALASATTLRADEKAKFEAQEADMKETRMLLGQAVDVLSKVQLVQSGRAAGSKDVKEAKAALIQVKEIVAQKLPGYQSVMQKDLFDVLGSFDDIFPQAPARPTAGVALRKRVAAALAQSSLLPWEKTDEQKGQEKKANDEMGAASGAKSYNSRSGSILGILAEMKDQFSRDLAKAQYDEYNAVVAFQKLSAAKKSEIFTATEEKKRKEKALSDLLDAIAKAKADKASLEEAKAADETFLAGLEASCKVEDEGYHKRLEIRTEEIRALSETLKILSADEARATFSRSRISLIQKSAADTSGRTAAPLELQDRAAERAMQRIAKVAQKHGNWALASLAVRVRLDSFTKVLEMMDKMLADLQAQQKEEYQKWEFCKTSIDKTEDDIKVKTQVKKDLDEKHTGLVDRISTLSTDTDTLKQQVADNEKSLKEAGEERKAENQLYQQSVMDQRAAVNILNKALARLKEFYASKDALVQTGQEPGAAAPPPPPKGKAYEKSGGASGVLQVIAQIISDAKSAEKELDVTENAAQARYAALVKDLTASIEADRSAIEEKSSQKASAEVEKSETEEAQLANDEELTNLESLLKSHHLDCDFLLKYFDLRQQARGEEMDAISDAKAILSGADFGKR
jgi:chromosome segregation ATPase